MEGSQGLSESSLRLWSLNNWGAHDPIHASPHDLHKLSERAPPSGTGFIWRQVAPKRCPEIWPSYLKMPAATRYVAGLIFVGWPK